MTIFLAWVGGITILILAVVGVTYLGVTIWAQADLTDMGPDSWGSDPKPQDHLPSREETDLATWKERQW